MSHSKKILIIFTFFAIIFFSCIYTVDQRQQVLISQFGKIVKFVKEPGLKFKIPFVQEILVFDKRILDFGIKEIDTSLGGIGGSPYIKNSKGNIATEDVAYLMGSMGYDTGLDIKKLSGLSNYLEKKIGSRYFGGKIYKLIR